jgi:hypothetical protein
VGQLQFGRDAEALVERVREALTAESGSVRPWRGTAVAGAAAAALFLVGWVGFNQGGILASELASAPPTVQLDTRDVESAKAATEVVEERVQQRVTAVKAGQERRARVEIRVGF